MEIMFQYAEPGYAVAACLMNGPCPSHSKAFLDGTQWHTMAHCWHTLAHFGTPMAHILAHIVPPKS